MWDVCVHFLEIKAAVRLLGGGRHVQEVAPYKRGGGGKPPTYAGTLH